ncbi:Alpha-1 4-glucan:maltose-1-phosphate maltosyltransferase [Bienertia sinuspersici]
MCPKDYFKKLLILWNKKTEKDRCSSNKSRQKGQRNMHTAGPKIFARIREEMKNEDPNKQLLSLAQLFECTRKR